MACFDAHELHEFRAEEKSKYWLEEEKLMCSYNGVMNTESLFIQNGGTRNFVRLALPADIRPELTIIIKIQNTFRNRFIYRIVSVIG